MTPVALGNLIAWSLQIALVAGVGLVALWLARVEAPAVRYVFLRALLVLCLVLPVLQPRLPLGRLQERPSGGGIAVDVSPRTSGARLSPAAAVTQLSAPAAVAAVIAAGTLLRLLWIAAGIGRLRRLRRVGVVADASEDHDDLQRVITRRATIRYVRGLGQPVTFGFRSPVILLPAAVRDLPPAIQRAVLAHELWHVRRADWFWTLCEEGLRAVLWFHPIVWALLTRIQSAREEVVDELTVLTTGSRRTYVDALLAFADSPSTVAAPAFAQRRHLVRRLVLISKEAVMSGRRVVLSGAAVGAVVLFTGWFSVQAFPMREGQASGEVLTNVAGPVEQRARPITPENPVPRRTRFVEASEPAELELLGMTGSVAVRLTLDEAGHVVETRVVGLTFRRNNKLSGATSNVSTAEVDRLVDSMYRDAPADAQATRGAIHAMATAAVRAVSQWQYAAPAEGPIAFNVAVSFGAAPPPPPPPPPGARASRSDLPPPPPPPPARPATSPRPGPMRDAPPPPPPPPPAQAADDAADPPLRVGGTIKPPTKVKNVNPPYPPDAQEAKIQGVVIIEARIERDGTVSRARVLRSIPMLDDAAVDAVRQWEFTPTYLNGVAVPIIMTVTVNFTLQ